MASSPYRVPGRQNQEEQTCDRGRRRLDVSVLLGAIWLMTIVRLALSRDEPFGQEIGLAWLIALAAPIVVWSELRRELPP